MSLKQKTYKLIEPVTFAGQEYQQLTFRKLKVKHLLDIKVDQNANPVTMMAELMAASAAVDVGVIHELDYEDFERIQEVMGDFFNRGQQDNPPSTPSTS
jgi:hypothetical protein